MLDGLAQGKYHTEIADDLIELSDDLVKSDADVSDKDNSTACSFP